MDMDPQDIVKPHDVTDWNKLRTLLASMETSGWVGAPIVVISGQDVRAITGTHRLAAAIAADIDVPTVELDELLGANGTNLAELVEKYGDEYEALTRLAYHLPAEVVAEYGIDFG